MNNDGTGFLDDYFLRHIHSHRNSKRKESPFPENLTLIFEKDPEWSFQSEDDLLVTKYVEPKDADDSLEQLIGWYTDKKSRRVTNAGERLRKAFPTLPPVEQRKVGLALLGGNKHDSEWVCEQLQEFIPYGGTEKVVRWHPEYASSVVDCWNKYHGEECGKLFIHYMDEQTLKSYMYDFTNTTFYFDLCCRMINSPGFELDVELLKSSTNLNTYLLIMSQTEQGITSEEARQLLFQWVGTFLGLRWKYRYMQSGYRPKYIFTIGYENPCRTVFVPNMDKTIYYLLKMGHKDVVDQFVKWDEDVHRAYYKLLAQEGECKEKSKDLFMIAIKDSFPKEFIHFTKLDKSCYSYLQHMSVPYVIPRPISEELNVAKHPPFRPESDHREEIIQKIVYESIVDDNAAMPQLIESLGLQLDSIQYPEDEY